MRRLLPVWLHVTRFARLVRSYTVVTTFTTFVYGCACRAAVTIWLHTHFTGLDSHGWLPTFIYHYTAWCTRTPRLRYHRSHSRVTVTCYHARYGYRTFTCPVVTRSPHARSCHVACRFVLPVRILPHARHTVLYTPGSDYRSFWLPCVYGSCTVLILYSCGWLRLYALPALRLPFVAVGSVLTPLPRLHSTVGFWIIRLPGYGLPIPRFATTRWIPPCVDFICRTV